MDSDTDADESVAKTALEVAQEQLKIAKEQIETYQLLNRDLSGKVQEFKLMLNAANCEVALLRENLMTEKIKSSELRRTLRVMHGKFTIFYGDYADLMRRCVEHTDLDLALSPEAGTSDDRALLFKPPSKMQGNFTHNETNILNTIREEQESRLSSFGGNPELIPQDAEPLEQTNHDIQSEADLFTPLTEPLPSEQSEIQQGTSSASAVLKPRVFMNNNESNISCFSVASDATSTPLQALNAKGTAKPPSTITEESEDESSQNAHKGLIGETPRRRSQDNNIRAPPVRRISQESSEEDETPLIAQPEGSVEREMRKAFGESQSSDLDELAERVGTNDSPSDSDDSRDCREEAKINKRRNAILTRRKSSYVVGEILDEIQEEVNTSNKENSLPSPERSLEDHFEDVSPSKVFQPPKNSRHEAVNHDSQLEEPEDQASTAPVGESSKKTRGRPRKVAEIASDEDDEEEPPKKIQKSPPRRLQKSPLKKMQKATPKKTQKSPPKKIQKTPAKKAQQTQPTPTKTLRQRNAAQKPQDSDVEEVQPVKRAKYRRVVVHESSSDDDGDDEEFKDAQPDVQESSSEDEESADAEHVPVTRVCSVELKQLHPSESMLEAFNNNYEKPVANSERASSVETVASCSENGDAPVVTKGQPSRKRDLSTESERSEASSTYSIASSAATETTQASTSSQVTTTTRKRKPKPEPVRKSRPPRRKARLAPGSLVEKSLRGKLRRSK